MRGARDVRRHRPRHPRLRGAAARGHGPNHIHGVREQDLIAAIALVGWRCTLTIHPGSARPTLAAWLRDHDTFAESFVLVVRNHYVALGNGEIADSGWIYDRRPKPVATAPHRRVQVRRTIACRPAGGTGPS